MYYLVILKPLNSVHLKDLSNWKCKTGQGQATMNPQGGSIKIMVFNLFQTSTLLKQDVSEQLWEQITVLRIKHPVQVLIDHLAILGI